MNFDAQRIGLSTTTPDFSKLETIWVVGFPRSGNTWLSRLLGDALNSPVHAGYEKGANADEGFDRPGSYVIRQSHVRQDWQEKTVFILRDPRDVAISRAHYFDESLDDIFHRSERLFAMRTWQDYVAYCWARVDAIVTYEGLHLQPLIALRGVLDLLAVDYDLRRLSKVIARQSFSERKRLVEKLKDQPGRFTYGPVHENEKVLRHGIVGDWRNEMTVEDGEFADELFSPLLYELGYEDNASWWKDLPSRRDRVA